VSKTLPLDGLWTLQYVREPARLAQAVGPVPDSGTMVSRSWAWIHVKAVLLLVEGRVLDRSMVMLPAWVQTLQSELAKVMLHPLA